MAETIGDLIPLNEGGSPRNEALSTPGGNLQGASSELAVKARAWFLEAKNHILWDRYIREAQEDEGYYVGGIRQWSKDYSTEDARRLEAAGRPVLSINHCKATVDVLVGFERQNRMDIKASPVGEEDEQDAKLMTQLIKFVSDQAEVNETISEGFKLGIVRGMALFDVGLDWTADPVNGEIVMDLLTPGRDVIWDPHSKKYNLSDARFVIRFKWAWVDDLIAQYPDSADEIIASTSRIASSMAESFTLARTTDGASHDAYGSVTGHVMEPQGVDQQFYDPELRRALVLEVWYRTYESQWIVSDKATGKVEEFGSGEEARSYARSDPDHLTAQMRRRRIIRTGTVLPATLQTLEEDDTPYDNDTETYPFVQYQADRMGDEIMGIIRNMKDPQRIENKLVSQSMELVAKFANIRPVAEENALVKPDALENPGDNSVVWVRPGHKDAISWLYPAGLGEAATLLSKLADSMKQFNREIPGVNADLLGIQQQSRSGIAMARQQAQGQTISTPYFDNLRRTRKLIGQRIAKRIQQRFSTEDIVRLTNEIGQPVVVRINPVEYQHMSKEEMRQARLDAETAGKPHVLRDMKALKYDIAINEAPTTPTARLAVVQQLLDVVEKFPAVAPALMDVLFELIPDLPDRALLVERVRRLMPPQVLNPQPPEPPSPAGLGQGAGPGSQPPLGGPPGMPSPPVGPVGPVGPPAPPPMMLPKAPPVAVPPHPAPVSVPLPRAA